MAPYSYIFPPNTFQVSPILRHSENRRNLLRTASIPSKALDIPQQAL